MHTEKNDTVTHYFFQFIVFVFVIRGQCNLFTVLASVQAGVTNNRRCRCIAVRIKYNRFSANFCRQKADVKNASGTAVF